MKDFIFRAWDKKNQKMIYPPSPCDSNLGPYHVTFDGRCYLEGRFQDLEYLPWTGLYDMNGDEIYEGDILGGNFEGGYVQYCETCKNLQYHAGQECFACNGDVHWYELVEEDGALEVIGNIFQNPNLMV